MERAGNRFALYQSLRVVSLLVVLISLLAWSIFGFDVAEGSVPLIGIQWSTFATFFFFFYLLSVNYHSGGLTSFRQLGRHVKWDFLLILRRYPASQYPNWDYAVNPWAATVTAFLVCLGATFLFEAIWVPLYDITQFGSLLWPVYQALPFGYWAFRNLFLGLFPLAFALFALPAMVKLNGIRHKSRIFFTSWRFNGDWLWLVLVAASCWFAWIFWPRPDGSAMLILPTVKGAVQYQAGACYIWPTMRLFPQNTYTFYPCGLFGHSYPLTDILSGFSPDAGVHAINVVTKFATFGAVCYPFMARVKRP